MFKLTSLTTVAAASALVLVSGGALASAPVITAGTSGPDLIDTTLAADASVSTPSVTLTAVAPTAMAAAPSGTRKSARQALTERAVMLGTKHGLSGTVTFTGRGDVGGRLHITGLDVPKEDRFTIDVYRGTKTPVTGDNLLFSWVSEDASRHADGSVVIDLTEAQVAQWRDARSDQGVLVRVSDGTRFGEATYATK